MFRIIIVLGSLTFVTAAPGVLIGVIGDNQAPPASIGPFSLRAFDPDTRPLLRDETFVSTPFDGQIAFEPALLHVRVGHGATEWGHGYKGDVYWSPGGDVILDLQGAIEGTGGPWAFLLYVQARLDFESVTVRGISDTGESVTLGSVAAPGPPNRARWFGFYTDGASAIRTITISTSSGRDSKIGEFHIAVPEPGGSSALLLAVLVMRPRKRAKPCDP
jgi:hypothetical protein